MRAKQAKQGARAMKRLAQKRRVNVAALKCKIARNEVTIAKWKLERAILISGLIPQINWKTVCRE